MGQKVHPRVFRLGITQTWLSRWYKGQGYAEQLHQDIKLRQYVKTRLSSAGVSSVEVERAANRVKVSVRTARPGLVIGRKGKEIDDLRAELRRVAGRDVLINIVEVRKPDIDAQLVAETISTQLERRVNFRRVVKDVVGKAMRLGAEGIKVNISGRVGGAEIARSEWAREGKVSLHTLRSNIDYGFAEALTTYGIIGVKVWISKGLVAEPEDTTELSIGVM